MQPVLYRLFGGITAYEGESMTKRFVSSHGTKSEANNALHETVKALQDKGLVKRFGVKVESRGGAHYVVVVERL